jgi:dinuclear metal center YbgI/SA1388 family protein
MATVPRQRLISDLDDYLSAHNGRDYCPNGLQVEGCEQITRVALGVTASLALLQQAADWGAQCVVVHHGIFWKGAGELRVERSLRARLRLLLEREMTLLAYHLPLDRHPEAGNNAVLARRLGAGTIEPAFPYEGLPVGMIATLPSPMPVAEFVARVQHLTERVPLVIDSGPALIQRFGIVTGGAASLVSEASRAGLDLFLTGEPNEASVHVAREERIHLVAAGHHATERFGVQALARWIADRHAIETRYLEVPNPV